MSITIVTLTIKLTFMEDLLQKLGLEEKESAVYLACLKNELNSPASLARQTRLKRSTIYFYLDKLVQKGLVAHKIKGKRKGITPVAPLIGLTDFINTKSEEVERNKKVAQKLIPQLLQLTKERAETTQVHVYEGKAGTHAVIDALLKENKNIYWFGAVDEFTDIISDEEIYRWLTLKRMAQKNTNFAITDRRVFKKKRASETLGNFRKFRFLGDEFSIPAGFILFGEYTSLAVKHGKDIKVILIKDSVVTQLLQYMFTLLWDKLPEE
ncbi:MAG: helix-turn-helix domain-containing protein [Patescibacteria group bacterium]|jgi:sugar-specific transcriptional regulator TrmB